MADELELVFSADGSKVKAALEDIRKDLDATFNRKYSATNKELEQLENTLKRIKQQMRGESSGGIRADAFKQIWGFSKADADKAVKALTDDIAKAREKQREAISQERDKTFTPTNIIRNIASKGVLEQQELAAAQQATTATTQKLSQALADFGNVAAGDNANIVRLRYALYDVAFAAQAASQAFNTFNTATIGAAIDYESAFTPVERATQTTGKVAEELRQQLLDLSTELPKTFQDISGVAALGSALGIANEDLVSFTETVIQFSSASNVGIEAAANAFGALGELLGVTADQYNNLGSAIAEVGINSNATESQIISVAEALGGVAATVGFSADYTVGLAGALASLKVPAEQSRGALTRIFAEVNRATAEGGKQLDDFAAVLHVSSEEAKNLAAVDPSEFFNRFLTGLNGLSSEQLTTTLDDLGLADVRVYNTLSRLAGNLTLTRETIDLANESYAKGTFLGESYAKVQDDIATKLIELQNAVSNLFAEFGKSALPVIGPVLDILKELAVGLTELIDTPIGSGLASIATGVGLLGAAALATVAAVLPLGGGILALRTATNEALQSNNRFVASMGQFANGFNLIGRGSDQARISLLGLSASTNVTARNFLVMNGTSAQNAAALRVLQAQFQRTQAAGTGFAASVAANTGVLRAQLGMVQANIGAMSVMQRIIAGSGWLFLIGSAISAIVTATEAMGREQETAFEKAKKAAEEWFGSASALSAAFAADAGSDAQKIYISLSDGAEEYRNSVIGVQGANAELNESLGETKNAANGAGDAIALAYGENAQQAIRDLIAGSENFQKIIEGGLLQSIGGNPVDLVSSIIADPVNGVDSYVNNLTQRLNARLAEGKIKNEFGQTLEIDDLLRVAPSGTFGGDKVIGEFASALGISREQVLALRDDLIALRPAQEAINGELQVAATTADAAAVAQAGYEDAIGEAAREANKYKDALSKMSDANEAFDSLAKSIEENGLAFAGANLQGDEFTSNGIANTIALQKALESSVAAAEAMGFTATTGVSMVFAQLRAEGVETATILQQLQNLGYGAQAGGIQLAASGRFKGLSDAMNTVTASSRKAGGAVGGVSKQVRTLTDYANDLKNVFSRAFEIRFGALKSLDSISLTWLNIAKNIEEAREQVNEINLDIQSLNASIGTLTADRALLEYFLSVAEAYGDVVRAQELRAEIAEIDAEIAKKSADLVKVNNDLAKAQAKANKSLAGNSEEAIANRSELLGLISNYQDYIASLASSGASQETLRARAAQLKQEFIAQATQLGYNQQQVTQYAAAFDDVATAINNVPRNITVTSNVNPALQALSELNARANAATASRTMTVGTSIDYAGLAKFSRGIELATKLANLQTEYAKATGPRRVALIYTMSNLQALLASGNFASGGYVSGPGTATSDSIPANLSNGEYVIRAAAVQKFGVGFFDRLNQMQAPAYYSGGQAASAPSSMMVELSPTDRALLRNAGGSGEVVLAVDGVTLARAVNQGNQTIVAQGGRR